MSLWERISSDPRYLKTKRKIQARYGLPLDFDIRLDHQKWSEWIGAEEKSTSRRAKRGQAFFNDVHALFKKFLVPDTWYPDFIAEIAGLTSENRNYPKFNLYKDENGRWKWECITTPETDPTNSLTPEQTHGQPAELEEREMVGMPTGKPEGVMAWVKGLWGMLRKGMRRK